MRRTARIADWMVIHLLALSVGLAVLSPQHLATAGWRQANNLRQDHEPSFTGGPESRGLSSCCDMPLCGVLEEDSTPDSLRQGHKLHMAVESGSAWANLALASDRLSATWHCVDAVPLMQTLQSEHVRLQV